jgi:hypothetical protein
VPTNTDSTSRFWFASGVQLNSEKDKTRLDIAQYVGTLLAIVMLESRIVSRGAVFLLAPFVFWLCLFAASPIARDRWRRTLPLATLASVLGYLLVRFVFTRPG